MHARAVFLYALIGVIGLLPVRALGQSETDQLRRIEELYDSGDYQDALAVAKEHLADTQKKYGEGDRTTAKALSWMGLILEADGHYREAEEFYERTLASEEAARGPSDPLVAEALETLANFYSWQGRFAEAEPL